MAVEVITIQLPGAPGSPGPKGDPGNVGVLTIGTVATGTAGSNAVVTISDVAPNQKLNLTIPRGDRGDQGIAGVTPTIASGTINTGAPGTNVVATLTGTAPNYLLNLTIPRGATGLTGPANVLTVGTVTTTAPGTSASVTITGTAPAQTINFTIPQGPQGIQGVKGDTGSQGLQGVKGDKGDPGNAVGVPIGGASGAVLSKSSANDYDTGWTLVATTGDANAIVKRDANGRAQVANASAAGDIMNKQSVDASITTHNTATSVHGASGNIVGENNTQTITNKTLTAPKMSLADLAQTDSPGNPSTGYNRLAVSSAGLLSIRNSAGAVRNLPVQWPNATAAWPTGAQVGDSCYHTALRSMHFYDGTTWRQMQTAVFDTESAFTTWKGSLGSLPIEEGFNVFCKDTERNYQLCYGVYDQWQYTGGGTPKLTDLPLVTSAATAYAIDGTFSKPQYGIDASGFVFMTGLLKLVNTLASGTNVLIGTLPTGFRPVQIPPTVTGQLFDVTVQGAFVGRMDVDVYGAVHLSNNTAGNYPANAWISLYNVRFPANKNSVVSA